MSQTRLPSSLQKGDTVALISPASRLDESDIRKAATELKKLGFCVVRYPKAKSRHTFFSSGDEDRARELFWALSEPGIRAILSIRGGYGSVRTVRAFESMYARQLTSLKKQDPKIFVGYSDCTYLHQWFQNTWKWVTFHGPLMGKLEAAQIKRLMTNLTELSPRTFRENWNEVGIFQKGVARGKLVGGNLSLLSAKGKASLPEEPIILAIEDVNESHYRIDRMIWGLIDAGYDRFVKGIIVGKFLRCGEKDRKIFPEREWLASLKHLTSGPIWTGGRFGHGVRNQRLLALGLPVKMTGKYLIYERPQVQVS